MRIVVTGGAGFIGSTLTAELLSHGHAVDCYDCLDFGVDHLLSYFAFDSYKLLRADVRHRATFKDAVQAADAIVHLAAIVGSPACKRRPQLAREVNVDAVRTLNSVRSKAQPVLFASTGSVYGALAGECTEKSPLNPLTLYAQTKAEAERVLLDAGNVVVLRLATAFGLSPLPRLDLLPNQLAYRAAHHRSLEIYEAHFKRTFLHVRDIARAFLFSLDNFETMRDEVWNCGDERLNVSKLELANSLDQLTGCGVSLIREGKDEDQRDYWVSYERVRRLGFRASVSLETGLREMVRAFRHLQNTAPYRLAAA